VDKNQRCYYCGNATPLDEMVLCKKCERETDADCEMEKKLLRELLADVAASAVELEDERVTYVAVQLDSAVWQRVKKFERK
jgi:hypothetical protein